MITSFYMPVIDFVFVFSLFGEIQVHFLFCFFKTCIHGVEFLLFKEIRDHLSSFIFFTVPEASNFILVSFFSSSESCVEISHYNCILVWVALDDSGYFLVERLYFFILDLSYFWCTEICNYQCNRRFSFWYWCTICYICGWSPIYHKTHTSDVIIFLL